MTQEQALMLIKILTSAYPRQELREDTIKTYVYYLQDLDYKVAQQVIDRHIRTQKWFPSISEIREAAAEKTHRIPGVEEAMADLRVATAQGVYALVASNPLLVEAVKSVGWGKLMHNEYPEPLYRQIREAYARLRAQRVEELASAPGVAPVGRMLTSDYIYRPPKQNRASFTFLEEGENDSAKGTA